MKQEKKKQALKEEMRESLDSAISPFKPILRYRATIFDQAQALLRAHGIVFDKDSDQLPGVVGEFKTLSRFWARCKVYFGRETIRVEWTEIDRKKNQPRQRQQYVAIYELYHFRFLS